MATRKATRKAYYDYDEHGDFFDNFATDVETKPDVETCTKSGKISPEQEYIEVCFLDFKDSNRFSITSSGYTFKIKIPINIIKSSTFLSYKNFYNSISNDMDNIDESLLKVKMKYPHSNTTISVDDYINIKIEI